MSQAIISLNLKAVKEQSLCLLSIVNLALSLPKLSTRQSVRAVCVAILIVGAFHLSCNVSEIYAVPEVHELEKVLDVDDSEVIPAIEEKTKKNLKVNEGVSISEKAEDPIIKVSSEGHSPGKDAIYHFNLGVDHQKQGNTLKAIEEYENVLKSDPNNAEAHNNLGVIYKEQNDLDKAMEHYLFVVTTNPGMDEAHNNLGVIYYLRGDQREAVQEYLKALEINPNNLMSHINLGLIYKARGMKLRAIDTLENVLSEQPFHPEAHYNLAIIYEELGHLERAVWHYTHFVDNAGKGYPDLIERVTGHIKDLKVTGGEVLRE